MAEQTQIDALAGGVGLGDVAETAEEDALVALADLSHVAGAAELARCTMAERGSAA